MTPETKTDIISIIKISSVGLVFIFGMMFASLWFIPFAYEAYDNDTISVEVYYIVWSLPIVTIGVVLIGTGLYMYYVGSDEPKRQPTTKLRPDR